MYSWQFMLNLGYDRINLPRNLKRMLFIFFTGSSTIGFHFRWPKVLEPIYRRFEKDSGPKTYLASTGLKSNRFFEDLKRSANISV
jgi:hypothetical protein